jgi:hypothetical protein
VTILGHSGVCIEKGKRGKEEEMKIKENTSGYGLKGNLMNSFFFEIR